MLATVIHAPRDIRVETVADPVLSTGGDAIVKVVAACVCGSDLWPYRGITPTHEPHRIGHEFIGVVEAVGDDVLVVKVGDFVIAPFYVCDNTCVNCRNGVSTSCLSGGWWSYPGPSPTSRCRGCSPSPTSWAPGITPRCRPVSGRATPSRSSATVRSGSAP